MHEFPQLPYPFPDLPEETYIDKKGRIWFSRLALLGFLEYYYAIPEEKRVPSDLEEMMMVQSSKKPMVKYHSNI